MVRDVLHHARVLLLPWSGWIGAGAGWALSQQIGSDFVQDHCAFAHPLLMILIGLIAIAVALGGGFIGWRMYRGAQGARRFVGLVGAMGGVLFSVAIFLQTSTSLILPRCYG